jgi:uncharacterized membrane protein YkvI
MKSASGFLRIYIVPGVVFQGIVVGGGYGTGREIVEYFSQYGTTGGLLGMAVATVSMGAVLVTTFEFARRFKVYEYRSLIACLTGPGWILYEMLAITMLLLVLAVTGAAAGTILSDTFGVPVWTGVVVMFALIVTLNFYGRDVVIRAIALCSVLLVLVFVAYFVVTSRRYGMVDLSQLSLQDARPGWFLSGLQYSLYNVAAVPMMLYAVRAIETRAQAVISGALAALFAMSLGGLFFLSFAGGPAEVVRQSLPTHWMIKSLAVPALMTTYIVVLFGAMIQTCVGILQGVNERLDAWSLRRTGRPLRPRSHALTAAATMLTSGGLSAFGIAALVARGYGLMAWGFLLAFVLPMMTVGVYRLINSPGAPVSHAAQADSQP